MNKQEQNIVERYWSSTKEKLSDCYTKPSIAKMQAHMDIVKEAINNNGYDLRIISYNTFMFTCAYRYTKNGEEFLVYHTSTKRQVIALY